MSAFWRNWLNIWCWGVALFGVVLAGAGFPATSAPVLFLVEIMNDTGAPVEFNSALRFGLGLQGALTLGLALLVAAGGRAAADLGERGGPTWRMITAALLVWYAVDSVISVANGFPLNAVSNTLLMIGFLVPAIAGGVLGRPATA